eukprot:315761_1
MESGLVSAPNSSGKSELVNPPVKQISKSSKSARSSYHDESIYHRLSVQHSSLKSDTKSAWNTAEQKSNEQISKHMAGLEMVCTCIYTIAKHNRPLLMMDEMIFVLESAMDSLRRANYDIPADIISSSFKKDNNRKISKTLTAMLNFIEKDVNTVIGQSLRAESKSLIFDTTAHQNREFQGIAVRFLDRDTCQPVTAPIGVRHVSRTNAVSEAASLLVAIRNTYTGENGRASSKFTSFGHDGASVNYAIDRILDVALSILALAQHCSTHRAHLPISRASTGSFMQRSPE